MITLASVGGSLPRRIPREVYQPTGFVFIFGDQVTPAADSRRYEQSLIRDVVQSLGPHEFLHVDGRAIAHALARSRVASAAVGARLRART